MPTPASRLYNYCVKLHTLAALNPALAPALGSYPQALHDANAIQSIQARNDIREKLSRPQLRPEIKFPKKRKLLKLANAPTGRKE